MDLSEAIDLACARVNEWHHEGVLSCGWEDLPPLARSVWIDTVAQENTDGDAQNPLQS